MDIAAEILLIQSDPRAGMRTLDRLWRFESGARTVWCRDGLEGLEYVFGTGRYWDRPADRVRAVFLDFETRVLDGAEVLRRIRGWRRGDPLFVAMMARRAARDAGVPLPRIDRWVHVPPTLKEIDGVLRAAGLGAVAVGA